MLYSSIKLYVLFARLVVNAFSVVVCLFSKPNSVFDALVYINFGFSVFESKYVCYLLGYLSSNALWHASNPSRLINLMD